MQSGDISVVANSRITDVQPSSSIVLARNGTRLFEIKQDGSVIGDAGDALAYLEANEPKCWALGILRAFNNRITFRKVPPNPVVMLPSDTACSFKCDNEELVRITPDGTVIGDIDNALSRIEEKDPTSFSAGLLRALKKLQDENAELKRKGT